MNAILRVCAMWLAAIVVVHSASAQDTRPAPQAAPEELDSILNLIPADAQGAAIVPNLKRLSDQLTQMLEGMDRANILMGSRPIDQLKAAFGFNVGINDAGALAIVQLGGADQPQWVYLVPVSDAQTFLDGNFTAHDGDAYTLPSGTTVYAKTLDGHVALSPIAQAVREYRPGNGMRESLIPLLGERAQSVLTSGEVVIIGMPEGLRQAFSMLTSHAAQAGMPLPAEELVALPLFEEMEIGVRTLDFDALGLISRSLVRFRADSPAAALKAGEPAAQPMSRLPNKPFYFAASLDVSGINGISGLASLAQLLNLNPPPQWMSDVHAVQFAAYPSPAGLSGGLLNDAVLVIQTPQPQKIKDAIRQQLLALQSNAQEPWQVKWEADKRINQSDEVADVYDAKPTFAADDFQFSVLWQNLFGSAGWRGFVKQTEDSVVMTFSQRPAVLKAALDAASGGTSSLQSYPAFRTMHALMPQGASFEAYLGVSQMAQLAREIAASFGEEAAMPDIDPNLPPIGFGAAVIDRGAEGALIVPAGVLALALDQAIQFQPEAPDDEMDDGNGAEPMP